MAGMKVTGLGLMGLLCACQVYDFQPVVPLGLAQIIKDVNITASPPKPALMLVVDKSRSMTTPLVGGGSRMTAMQAAMDTFLTNSGAAAHLGMLPFPTDVMPANSCLNGDVANFATIGVALDQGDEDDARLTRVAAQVKTAIDVLVPNGGTPTGATMRTLGTYPPLLAKQRDNFAVLLTDGLPNCNPDLAPQASTCTCTASLPAGSPCQVAEGGRVQNQCLDDQGVSAEIALLAEKHIRTIVIVFGTDVDNVEGKRTLGQMATAGAFTRPCTTSADCNSGDTCNSGGVDPCGRPASTCGQNYFTAGNAAELGKVLDAIKASVTCPTCLQVIAPPSDPALISVLVDGDALQPGPDTWEFRQSTTAPTIEFLGALCDRLKKSTVADPVHVEIRSVQTF
ncbi:MAG: adventurous gliding motility lipoprotein CglB [Archangiaceae bacterium]|nr:adventurous gliding motility lipoprotein CglB [Archangiaceae bacterium]